MNDIPVPLQLVMRETERLPRWYSQSLLFSSSSNEVTATDITTTHANDPSPMGEASAPRRRSRRLLSIKRVVMREVDEFVDEEEEEEREDDTSNDESQEAPSIKHTAKKRASVMAKRTGMQSKSLGKSSTRNRQTTRLTLIS